MGWMKQSFLALLLTSSVVLLRPLAAAEATKETQTVAAELRTTVGQNLDPENPQGSLTFEPLLQYRTGEAHYLQFYTAVNRPFKSYENFSMPLTMLKFNHSLKLWSELETVAAASLSALNLHRWSTDGAINRGTLSLTLSKRLTDRFLIQATVAAFGQLNEYRQTTSGNTLPGAGFTERLTLVYEWKKLTLDAHFAVSQSLGDNWSNSYRFYQQASYPVTDTVTAGIAHELLGSVISDTTGFYQPLQFFDSRDSRLSAFVTVAL